VTTYRIPFNKPHATGKELEYIQQAIDKGQLSGNGFYTKKCQEWLQQNIGCHKAFLTHSGTAALEMAAMLLDLKPGDEVIMPSFTFVTTASAFVLRGAVPVFVDIRPDTLNIDESKIEAAITERTRAIVPVHYAGIGCDMDAIMRIAEKHKLIVVEDAAHCVHAAYKSRQLGSIGHLAALSFHETKNIIAGEAGALLINDKSFADRAAIVWEKGTNRAEFYMGLADKYTWKDIGSSFLPSEMVAAFLWAQMEQARQITDRRLVLWNRYHALLADLEKRGLIVRPTIPEHSTPNAHLYYFLVSSPEIRSQLLKYMNEKGVLAVFHYVPLHQSPAGRRYGRCHEVLQNTDKLSEQLVRIPLFVDLTEDEQDLVLELIESFFKEQKLVAKTETAQAISG
jgi:dTDP-4-amino-4,6-dideoxygalactose transaminase